jgi:bla regulator protein BlaR1
VDDLFRVSFNNAAWAGVLAIVAAVGARIWRNRPSLAHAFWLLVLLKLATPSVFMIPQPWPDKADHEVQMVSQPENLIGLPALARVEMSPSRGPEQRVSQPRKTSVGRSNPERDTAVARNDTRSTLRSTPWRTLILLVWLTGAGIWWGFVALSFYRFRRLLASVSAAPDELQERVRREAARMGLRARQVPIIGMIHARMTPLVWASLFRTPRLVLPGELWDRLDVSQQNAVLAHELAHLKRGDHWARWLEVLVVGVYWWDPVAWWARREIERIRRSAHRHHSLSVRSQFATSGRCQRCNEHALVETEVRNARRSYSELANDTIPIVDAAGRGGTVLAAVARAKFRKDRRLAGRCAYRSNPGAR